MFRITALVISLFLSSSVVLAADPAPVAPPAGTDASTTADAAATGGNVNLNILPPPAPKPPRLHIEVKRGPNLDWTKSQQALGMAALGTQSQMVQEVNKPFVPAPAPVPEGTVAPTQSSDRACNGTFSSKADTQQGEYVTECKSVAMAEAEGAAANTSNSALFTGPALPPPSNRFQWKPGHTVAAILGGAAIVGGVITYGIYANAHNVEWQNQR